jgi:hypothetical protein
MLLILSAFTEFRLLLAQGIMQKHGSGGFSTCTWQSVNSVASIAQIQSADIIKKKAYKTIF